MITYCQNFLQMTRTRTGAGGSEDADGSGPRGNDNVNLPLPLPLPLFTAEQFFAQFLGSQRNMEEVLRNIAANTAHGQDVHQGNDVNQYSIFKDFMDTKPPVFREAAEPLEADE
jgi:hypothetical protein